MTLQRPNKKERALAREILFEARRLLARPKGWVKGTLTDRETVLKAMEIDATGVKDMHPHCAVGGLDVAARALLARPNGGYAVDFRQTTEYQLAELELKKALRVAPDTTNWAIFNANDKRSTRKKDIVAAFDAAVEALS